MRRETLNQILILLCHHFPTVSTPLSFEMFDTINQTGLSILVCYLCVLQVRKTTADQLYITMVTYDDIIDEEVSDDVISILSNTTWSVMQLYQ